jgi:hypothetical protein
MVFQPGVVLGEREIRPDLRRGIPQPHGVNVPRDDEGVGFAVQFPGTDGGVQGIGETVFEHPGEFGVGDAFLDRLNFGLDGIAGKPAVRERRAAGRVGSRYAHGQGRRCEHGGLEEGASGSHRIAMVEQCPAV